MVHRECLMACYKDFIGTREGWSEQLTLCLFPPCVMHLLKPMPKTTSHHFVFHACMCVHTITKWQWIILKENLSKLHFALVNLNIQLTLCLPALCWLLLIGCFDLLQVQVQHWGSVVVVLWGLVLAVLPISQGIFRLKLWADGPWGGLPSLEQKTWLEPELKVYQVLLHPHKASSHPPE